MSTKIQLQEMFSYSKLPIIIIGSLVVLYILVLVAQLVIKKMRIANARKTPKVKEINIPKAQERYLKKLEFLRERFVNGEVNIRGAYQEMSVIIRDFIYASTGRTVMSYTLEDVKKAGMPALQALMEEYYTPEFAKHSDGDVIASIDKTKRAIETWN